MACRGIRALVGACHAVDEVGDDAAVHAVFEVRVAGSGGEHVGAAEHAAVRPGVEDQRGRRVGDRRGVVVRVDIGVGRHRRRCTAHRDRSGKPVRHDGPGRAAVEAPHQAEVAAHEHPVVVLRIDGDHLVVEGLVVHHIQVGLVVVRVERRARRVDS